MIVTRCVLCESEFLLHTTALKLTKQYQNIKIVAMMCDFMYRDDYQYKKFVAVHTQTA